MTNLYTVLADFWHKNVLVPTGSVIEMTENEAKYLMHALEIVKGDAVDAAGAVGTALKGKDPKPKIVEDTHLIVETVDKEPENKK